MKWNLVSMLLIFEVLTESGGQDSAEIWRQNEEILNTADLPKPVFYTKGVRISEAKCREYIWDILEDEITLQRNMEYKQTHAKMASIIGGRDADPAEFPHMGAVGWKGKKAGEWVFMCGSSLISEEFLLTAAHCYWAVNKNIVVEDHPAMVRLGVENTINDQRKPLDMNITKFIIHPKYLGTSRRDFDIALIQLTDKVKFTKYVRPACIRNQHIITGGTVTGWGVVDRETNSGTAQLQVADVYKVEPEICSKRLRAKISKSVWTGVKDYQMCAIQLNGTTAVTCRGDSGGPMQVVIATINKIKLYNVIAVTSFGFPPCGSRRPSVYTKTNNFVEWIEEVVWNVTTAKPNTENKKPHKHIVEKLETGFTYALNFIFARK